MMMDASVPDIKSSNFGNKDGFTWCGSRSYSMIVKDSANNVKPSSLASIDPSSGLITFNPVTAGVTYTA